MARRCVCSKLLDQLRTDPRLRVLPLAARAVWLEIVAGLVAFAPSGRIWFPESVTVSVSRWVSASESETGTHLETLRAAGLVAVDEDGLGLSVPDLVAAASRSEINRINGLKGGRPRKAPMPDGRQREMKYPITGGLAETEKTETEPSHARAREMTDSDLKRENQSSQEWVSVGMELAGILGLPETGRWNVRPVAQWLAEGADRDLLVAIAHEVRGRTSADIGSIRFMAREVEKALADRKAQAPRPDLDALMAARERWVAGGMVGPSPLLGVKIAA